MSQTSTDGATIAYSESTSTTTIGKHSVSSAKTDITLRQATELGDFLVSNKENMIRESLADHLEKLRTKKGIRKSDIIRSSGLDNSYVYQIFRGEKHPARDTLICLAFGLNLNEEDTQRMLKIGGYSELYPRLERDAVILFAIQRGMSLNEVDKLLFDNGHHTLLES